MRIGIDVGGTFTDGVLTQGADVLSFVKVPTQDNIVDCIGQAMRILLANRKHKSIERIVLSTTLITNLIARKQYDPTGLLLMPGPGINPKRMRFACQYAVIKGAVDYRGRIIEDIDPGEIDDAAGNFVKQGITNVAVACKFSQRNPSLENRVKERINASYPGVKVRLGWQTSGQLNWVRRANGTVYSLAVAEKYGAFIEQIKETMRELQIDCPVYVLKADGGVLTLETAFNYPLESIFTGPAASALGALATTGPGISAVVMDIGGTTTDLALILNGVPLLAGHGAEIDGYNLPVRSLAVSSLALGGDTSIIASNGQIALGKRSNKAYCLGGPCLTITDILVCQGLSDLSSAETISAKLQELSGQTGIAPDSICRQAINLFLAGLENKMEEMFKKWEEEPAYRIWQVMAQQASRPRTLVCVGGPAYAVGKHWAEKTGWKVIVPEYSPVTNAVGAALAKRAVMLEIFIDTERRTFSTNLGGIGGLLSKKISSLSEARTFAAGILEEYYGHSATAMSELIYEEKFNIVRGWHTTGNIYQLAMQTSPGVENYIRQKNYAAEKE